ncbi:MAG: ComEA family DNA-binding protein [Pseudomonadales bacterium]
MNRYLQLLLLCLGLALATPTLAAPEDGAVNINTADAETLAAGLKGVGLAKAEAIVSYRETHGDFIDIYELANVKGIGERTVEQNETRLKLAD